MLRKNMKKIVISLLLIIGLFTAVNIKAKGSFRIMDVKVTEKPDTTQINDLTYENLTLNSDVVFHKVGDYLIYEITLKNETGYDYTLKTLALTSNNAYIEYTCEDCNDLEIKNKEEKKVHLKATYKTQVANMSERLRDENFEVQLTLIDNNKDETIENPKTGLGLRVYTILGLIVALGIIALIGLKKTKSKIVSIIVLVLLIPIIVKAQDETLRLNININYKLLDTLAVNIINNAQSENLTEEEIASLYAVYTEPANLPTQPAQEVSGDYESILSTAEDDYGTSYYFRGNVANNYVNFAGMCWRIVRIEGDSSIKLILEDKDEECSATMNGNWDIPTTTGGSTFIGNFGYDNSTYSGFYIAAYLNPKSNVEKSQVYAYYNFQTGPLANYLDKLRPGNWCYNDKAYTTQTGETAIPDKKIYYRDNIPFYYDSSIRLYEKSPTEPTLKCPVESINRFVDVNYANNKIISATDMYVATLTADEVVYAGTKVRSGSSNYYLLNNYWRNHTENSFSFWTLSLFNSFGGNNIIVDLALVFDNWRGASNAVLNNNSCFRPAVVLKKGTVFLSGDGTQSNPYVIE